ncbi:P-type ATPase subfamily V [Trinorchestia longiramus]|nr:P-type ATPase subfamily V [Trinorchestia longiramus]
MLTGGVAMTDGEAVGNRVSQRHTDTPTMGETLRTILVPNSKGVFKETTEVRLFRCKKNTFLWDAEEKTFYKLPELGAGHPTSYLHTYAGLSWQEQARRRIVYGSNDIHVPVTPVIKLLFKEALNPFYIFQAFSVVLWFSDEYVYYATVIVVTSVISLVTEVYQMHVNQVTLSKTIQSSDSVEVLRENGQAEAIPSEQLVPGDVLLVPAQGCMMQCDAVLLQGNAIVNESMLTGESVPVTKTPIVGRTNNQFSDKEHSKHTLYCGTEVIQTRFYGGERVRAVVVRTSFSTNKGSLVRSIMYPPPVDFKFQQDSYKFVLVLVVIASFGFIYTVITKYMRGVSVRNIALDSLDLITIVIPPALPMAMTVGILYALRRLKSERIFCISPRTVNISGVLNCFCFDKTGTLTEDGLDLRGVIPVLGRVDIRGSVRKSSKSASSTTTSTPHQQTRSDEGPEGDLKRAMSLTSHGGLLLGSLIEDPSTMPNDHLLYAMASCHSITIINMMQMGEPLELRMFESTGWELHEPGQDDTSKYDMMMPTTVRPPPPPGLTDSDEETTPLEIGILRQFPFESSLQRMSVVTKRLGDKHWDVYCKGSPEKIASLSTPESVPCNFNVELRSYTDRGFRVLALAHRAVTMAYHKIQKIDREELECNLQFVGLLVMENRLKPETCAIIDQLKQANIRTIMVTGDNLLTALSVARECGLVGREDTVVQLRETEDMDLSYEPTTPVKISGPVTSKQNGTVSVEMQEPAPGRTLVAVDGDSWALIQEDHEELLSHVLVRGAVFARMKPDQKQQLVTHLQGLGYYVGMCGDGANDCGALKAAHAGISLSEAEASVASPFTSKDPNISCVPTIIKEGRTALVTSFGVFKYMAAYSLTQFVSIMILYSIDSNLTDFQYLYIDLFLITVFAIFFGRTHSYKGNLHPTSPPASLMSVTPILSLLLHMALVIAFQTICFFYVQEQSWYIPFNATADEDILAGHENYAVFSVSQFQYIILAVVFSRGPPYRQPLYTNRLLCGSLVIMTLLSVYITIWPGQILIDWLELVMPPADDSSAVFFRYLIVIFAIINSILAVIIEHFIVDYLIYRKIRPKCHNIEKSKKKFLSIEHTLSSDKQWPPLEVPLRPRTTAQPPSTKAPPPPMVQYQSSL